MYFMNFQNETNVFWEHNRNAKDLHLWLGLENVNKR
jgi:hypothetical protein